MTPEERLQDNLQFIRRNYNKPGHPIAYGSPNVIYKYLIKIDRKVPTRAIRDVLQEFDAYNLHKEYKRPKYYNPYFIYARRTQVQADLIDVRQLSTHNDGINYLFILIDAFSKRLWAYPLRTKTGLEVSQAFRKHLERNPAGLLFRELLVDGGKEFFNQHMASVLDEYSIHIQRGAGLNKIAICERVNKTIQVLIYKYLSQNETLKYIDALDSIIETYNRRPHRTLRGMSPAEADKPLNEVKVRGILREKYAKVKRESKIAKQSILKVGTVVRIKTLTGKISSDARAYAPQFHQHYYVIHKVDQRLPRVMYHLKSMDTEEEIIGGFYRNELSVVKGDVWKVEKILKSKGKGRSRKHLVRWLNFGPRWDSWISDSDITNTYDSI